MIYFNSDIRVLLKFETMSSVNYVASFNLDAIQIGKLKITIFQVCWSTRNECPCSKEERVEGAEVSQASSAIRPNNVSSTVSIIGNFQDLKKNKLCKHLLCTVQ